MFNKLLVVVIIFSIIILVIDGIIYFAATNNRSTKSPSPLINNTPTPTIINSSPIISQNPNDLYGLKLSDFHNLTPDKITPFATTSGTISSLPNVQVLGSVIIGRFQKFTNHTIVVKKNETEISIIMPNGFILYVKDGSDNISIMKVSDDNPNIQQRKDYYMNLVSNNLTIVGNIRQNINGSFEGQRMVIFIQKF